MDIKALVTQLRELGVKTLTIELDAPPAPSLRELVQELDGAPTEPPDPNACEHPGCGAPRGYTLAPELCPEHGRAALGVR